MFKQPKQLHGSDFGGIGTHFGFAYMGWSMTETMEAAVKLLNFMRKVNKSISLERPNNQMLDYSTYEQYFRNPMNHQQQNFLNPVNQQPQQQVQLDQQPQQQEQVQLEQVQPEQQPRSVI
jgi:hypothetical protein